MVFLRWVIGGLIGGAIGTAIWVAIGYASGYEVGWIAWGVGFLVGLGVRIAAGDEGDPTFAGITACAIAIGSVVLAKYLVVVLLINSVIADFGEFQVTDHDVMIAKHGQAIADGIEESGGTVNWPPEDDSEDLPIEKSYPPQIWARAKTEWESLSPEQQEAEIETYENEMNELMGALTGSVRGMAFSESFGLYDALWFGLAAFTALRVGSATGSDD